MDAMRGIDGRMSHLEFISCENSSHTHTHTIPTMDFPISSYKASDFDIVPVSNSLEMDYGTGDKRLSANDPTWNNTVAFFVRLENLLKNKQVSL